MGLIARIAERGTWSGPFNLKDSAQAVEYLGYGSRTAAGPVVNEMTALACAAFFDGVQQISADVAKLPLILHKKLPTGGSEQYTDSPLYKLLKFSPNPETRSMVFRRTITMHALIYGNGYAEIVRNPGTGQAVALWGLHPTSVVPFYDDARGRRPLRYRVTGGSGPAVELDAGDVLHLRGMTDNWVTGVGLVSVAREAIGLALASQQFAAAFFGNGTRFGGVLSSDTQDIDDVQAEEIRSRVDALHKSANKAFRLLVLGMGLKFTETGTKPNDAQMAEVRDQQVAEIARFLNMPLHKLKLATPGAVSYASVEMADLDYHKSCLLTWITLWEEELAAKLIPAREQGNQFWKHNANAFLRGDIKSRYDALGIARDKGIISADEWRALEDMNPQPGGQGALYLVQSAQVPLNMLTQVIDAQITAATTPAAPVVKDDEADERFAAAEHEAADARLAEAAARTALVAAEATATATAGELTTLREELAARALLAENLEQISAYVRETLPAMTAERDTAAVDRAAALEDHAAADARASVAEAALVDLRQVHEEAQAALVTAQAALDAHADDLLRAQTAAETEIADAVEHATMRAAALEAERTRAAVLEEGHETLVARVAELEAAHAEALTAQAAQQEIDRDARITADLAEAVRAERHAATLAGAHRALAEDVAGRLTAREVDRARARGQSADTLRGWIATFYGPFEGQMAAALEPAVRVHLAALGDTTAPAVRAADLAAAYVGDSREALTALLEGHPDDLAVALAHTLTKWERGRPADLAAAVMGETT